MPYDVEAIRAKLKQTLSGRSSDPDEFKPKKAESTSEPLKYVFFILPPLIVGDKVKGGVASQTMEQFFVSHGNHWINDKPYACPRVCGGGDDCKICSFGFDLMKDQKVKSGPKDVRSAIVRQWMPVQYYMLNIYFPALAINPEELHGRVMYYNAPKTIVDICSACMMRDDDGGDPESPNSYGIFFDENAAFPFELQSLIFGGNNSYKTSKFRSTIQPMIKNKDKTPDLKAIAQMLMQRHDLFTKLDKPDPEKISKIFSVMVDADDSGDDKAGFVDEEKQQPKASAPAQARSTAKPKFVNEDEETPKKSKKPPIDDDEEDATASEKPLAKEKQKVTPPSKPSKANDDSDLTQSQIDNMLGQLDDDDD